MKQYERALKKLLMFIGAVLWLMSSGVIAGNFAQPKKTDTQKLFLDPSLTQMKGQLSFDQETIDAFKRGKEAGVLVAAYEEPNTIFRITIIGAKKVEPDAVVLRLMSKIGRPFNPIFVKEDIVEIMKMGLFSDVNVWYKTLPSQAVELIYELVEIPTIFQIKIVGNDALSQDEIKESIVGLEPYHVAKPSRLKESAEKIREFYVSKGYFLASVEFSTKKTSAQDIKKHEAEGAHEKIGSSNIEIDTAHIAAPDFVDVVFTIKENTQVSINKISFVGNQHIGDDMFKSHLRSRENHILSVLTDWGTFRKDFLEIDALIIEKILHDNGFLRAQVFEPNIELNPGKSLIDIEFRIIENEQYRLGDVSITGDLVEKSDVIYRLQKEKNPNTPLFLEKKLRAEITQNQGDIFNKSLMAHNVMAIAEKYRDKGFAYVNVSPVPLFNDDDTVDINVTIESGPKVAIERIDIEGNDKTKDEVIRRELLIFEGDTYSSTLLKLSEQNIQRLGYFETVAMTTRPGSSEAKMIVVITVKEQSTGNVQAGAGYGTGGEGLVLKGQVYNQNLFGRGQTLSATINWSSYRRMFDVAFVEPYAAYVFDHPLSLAFTAYNRNIFLGEFSRSAIGGDVTLGYPLGSPFAHISRKWKRTARPSFMPYILDFEALSFLMTYTLERVEISDLATDVRKWDLYQGVPRYTSSIKPIIRLDQRDNRIFPSRGIYFEFRSEFASEYLGGAGLADLENYIRSKHKKDDLSAGRDYATPTAKANNFIRFGTNFRSYFSLDELLPFSGVVFKTNLEIGILNTLGKPLVFENFSIGGSNTVRGYAERSLSPVERASALFPFDPRKDIRVGGNKQIYGSFELEFPIFKTLKLSGVLFFDFGNVFSYEDNFFYIGGKSPRAKEVNPADPLHLYRLFGLYSSVGGGVRWASPFGMLRFEWGIPLNPRPAGTSGLTKQDAPVLFQFNIGPSF